MRNLIVSLAAGCVAASASVALGQFQQVNRVFLDDVFNDTSLYGDQPAGISFDGTTAYLGGLNNGGNTDSVGVVAVSDLFGTFGNATKTPLAASPFTAAAGRGINSLGFDPANDNVLLGYDSGTSATSFIRAIDPATGALVWSTAPAGGQRVFAVAYDPGTGATDYAAYLAFNQGRRAAFNADTGANVYDFSGGANPGAIINTSPTAIGTAWRGLDFNTSGNIALAEDSGFGYGLRVGDNQFSTLGGTNNATSLVIEAPGANNLGRDIAILEGLGVNGTDLLAIVARDSTTFNPGGGATSDQYSVSDVNVFIVDLQGNLLQTITGSESGLATAFANDTKQLAYGVAPDGTPTLVIADLVERRLDVYQVPIPEPTSLGLLALGGLVLRRRR